MGSLPTLAAMEAPFLFQVRVPAIGHPATNKSRPFIEHVPTVNYTSRYRESPVLCSDQFIVEPAAQLNPLSLPFPFEVAFATRSNGDSIALGAEQLLI